jgi:NAD(P)-dependent dehydrogenase (short-subunit alcohol dehydrogenase family)
VSEQGLHGLRGAVVVVTGGAAGIGAACVRRFVAEGAHVWVADVQDAAGEALASELGERATYRHTDVTREDDVADLVDAVVAQHGQLDVLFANAAVFGAVGPLASLDLDAVDQTLAVNLRGVLVCAKHAARVMVPRGRGVLITTASPGGIIGGAGPHVYAAAKAGVIGLTRSVAAELRPHGVRAVAVVPGAVVSAMTADALLGGTDDLERASQVMDDNALGTRAGRPEDIAGAVAFLASDEARFVTGSELLVDDGFTFASQNAYFSGKRFADRGTMMEGGRRG